VFLIWWFVAIVALGAVILWMTPETTDKTLIRLNSAGRFIRDVRSRIARAALWPIGWPHLVDVAWGAGGPQELTPSDLVWQQGPATLIRYRGAAAHAEPVLVVHSLVTKPWILDLTPGRSLVKMLVDNGFDVYLLDWGDPGPTEATMGMAQCEDLVREAEAAVLEKSNAKRLHEVGYCMSATLLLQALAHDNAKHVGSLAVIAPPVDFAAPNGFSRLLRHRAWRPVLALDGDGLVPPSFVREAFHLLRPMAIKSMRLRRARRDDTEYCGFYAAMARWAWTHRHLPGATFFDVVDLFRINPFIPADGRPSPLASIRVPVFAAIAERDHIVPSAASQALESIDGLDVRMLNVPSGHVSMVVGSAGREVFWPALVEFLSEQQPPRHRTKR